MSASPGPSKPNAVAAAAFKQAERMQKLRQLHNRRVSFI